MEPFEAAQRVGQRVALVEGEPGSANFAENAKPGFGVLIDWKRRKDRIVNSDAAIVAEVIIRVEPVSRHQVA
jgi:hypothetical protein